MFNIVIIQPDMFETRKTKQLFCASWCINSSFHFPFFLQWLLHHRICCVCFLRLLSIVEMSKKATAMRKEPKKLKQKVAFFLILLHIFKSRFLQIQQTNVPHISYYVNQVHKTNIILMYNLFFRHWWKLIIADAILTSWTTVPILRVYYLIPYDI